MPPHKLRRFGGTTAALLVAAAPGLARQEPCPVQWDRPVACRLEIYAARAGEPLRRLDSGRLLLGRDEPWEIEFAARDQWGRSFPADRLAVRAEPEPDCRNLFDVDERSEIRFSVEARATRGSCRVRFWVPGNLNLDSALDLEIRSRAEGGYSASEVRLLSAQLYRGLLGRDPDPEGDATTRSEIARGRLRERIESILRSPEFTTHVRSLAPMELLERIYLELLGRAPDRAGLRTFLPQVERGRYLDVVMAVVGSDEFEAQLSETANGAQR